MSDPYNPGPGFRLRSPYGLRRDPKTGVEGQFHSGQDLAASEGTPIPAAMAGVVVYSGFNKNLGNTVIVRNGAGEYHLYAHMKDGAPRAQIGQNVWPRDALGQVGSTGLARPGLICIIRSSIKRRRSRRKIPAEGRLVST
jgi:murein DD-endopeptidase MepM/ murein hydrolase activator NlpD